MHLEWDLPNPLSSFPLQCTMRGIRRSIGDKVTQKLPITPELLNKILSQLDMSACFDSNIWSLCLVIFFGFLRKASVLPTSTKTFNQQSHICRKDITFTCQGVNITVRKTKTIQFQERALYIALPRCQGSPLCPTQALFHSLSFIQAAGVSAPAFVSDIQGTPISGPAFVARVRQCLESSGVEDYASYSGHSFRRGAACYAYSIGLDTPTIRALGDWRSSAYLGYIDINPSTKLDAVRAMCRHLPHLEAP